MEIGYLCVALWGRNWNEKLIARAMICREWRLASLREQRDLRVYVYCVVRRGNFFLIRILKSGTLFVIIIIIIIIVIMFFSSCIS